MGKKKQKTLPQPEPTRASLPSPEAPVGQLPQNGTLTKEDRRTLRIHYYVKIAVSTFLCALLLLIGVPVFMESRVTGSLSYTALGVVLVAFGLILALAVVILLFNPPFKARMRK